jgi:hypothetical protein
LISLKNLATVQTINGKVSEACNTLEKALVIAGKIFEKKSIKDMNVFKEHVQTCLMLQL